MLWKTQNASYSSGFPVYLKIIAGYICFAMFVATVAVLCIYFHRDKICSFVNLLSYFEEKLKGERTKILTLPLYICLTFNKIPTLGNDQTKSDLYLRYLSYLGLISINVVSSTFSLLNIFLPCTPPYIGSQFLNCNDTSWRNFAGKVIVTIFDVWINFFVCSNAMWGGFFLLFGGILFIKSFLRKIQW
jgi:hypothetical protein